MALGLVTVLGLVALSTLPMVVLARVVTTPMGYVGMHLDKCEVVWLVDFEL